MKSRFGAPLISSKAVFGNSGLGVTGAVIRATTGSGTNGPGILYNDWDSSADDSKEFRALILSGAPAGSFFYEDGSFTIPAGTADGTYTVNYRLFVDGVAQTPDTTATITIGGSGTTVVGVSLTTSFGVLAAVGASLSTSFGVTQAVGASLTTSFDVQGDSGLTPVGVNLTTTFPVLNAVGASLTTRFDIEGAEEGSEPVSVAEAALAARVDAVDELATLIASLITAAREGAEYITGRFYKSRVWVWKGTDWPRDSLKATRASSVEVWYWDGTAMVELDPASYAWDEDPDGPGTVIAPQLGMDFPELPPKAAGARVRVELTYTILPSTVPECVKTYIKAQVSGWLNNPDAVSTRQMQIDPRLDRLLDPERTWWF